MEPSFCEIQLGSSNPRTCLTCGESCQTCEPGPLSTCTSCFDGWYLDNSRCLHCPHFCTSCLSAQICQTCEPGFELHNNLCTCPPAAYLLGTNCLGKSSGTLVIKVLDCPVICSSCTNFETCQSCQPGYVLENNNCVCPLDSYLVGTFCLSNQINF